MLILAHAGHWLVSLAYFTPVASFVIWLAAVTIKEGHGDRDR